MKKLRCSEDLRIADCDLEVEGDTPGEIVSEVVEHLREEHGMDMPDALAITKGQVNETELDDKTWTVVKRIREALDISDVGVEDEESAGEERPALAPKK
jgi:predicted small metal-binding protein